MRPGHAVTTHAPPPRPAVPVVRVAPEAFTKHVGGVRRLAMEYVDALGSLGVQVDTIERATADTSMVTASPSAVRRLSLQLEELVFPLRRASRASRGVHHALYYDTVISTRSWPVVVTVYDMIHELFGVGSRRLRWAKRASVRRADHVVAISQHTADDVRRLLSPQCPVDVISPGISSAFLEPSSGERLVDGPYVLFIGARSGYKNFALLAAAWSSAPFSADARLVLAGGGDLTDSERDLLGMSGRRGGVVHLGHLDDHAVASLYRDALALVVPSRYEGFGLPVIEAMAMGCPVACSDTGSLPDVAAGHAALFPADSIEGCAAAIHEALATTAEQRAAARTYAQTFTWDRNARAHVQLFSHLTADRWR